MSSGFTPGHRDADAHLAVSRLRGGQLPHLPDITRLAGRSYQEASITTSSSRLIR